MSSSLKRAILARRHPAGRRDCSPRSGRSLQEDPFKTLQLAGVARFPSFVPELESASGITIGHQQTGTLRILPPEKVAPAHAWAHAWRQTGHRIEVLTPEEACTRELLLYPGLHGAVSIADEAQVAPEQLVKAFARAAHRAGTLIYEHTEAVALKRSETGDRIGPSAT